MKKENIRNKIFIDICKELETSKHASRLEKAKNEMLSYKDDLKTMMGATNIKTYLASNNDYIVDNMLKNTKKWGE